ncbi:MAG: LamG-like jellyroll fold domain-containing protein, partial [Planctomycetota bacterium]
EIIPGQHRQMIPQPIPDELPPLRAEVARAGIVQLAWERSARTIGLVAELHRSTAADFQPTEDTHLTSTPLFQFADPTGPVGTQHYALVLCSDRARSQPIRATVKVPPPAPPPAPAGLEAISLPGRVELSWREVEGRGVRYRVLRSKAGAKDFQPLSEEPTPELRFIDSTAPEKVEHAYRVIAVNRRGAQSRPSEPVVAAAKAEVKEPLFAASFANNLKGELYGGDSLAGKAHGKARVADGALDLRQGGYATFPHRPCFELSRRLSVEVWVRFTREAQMPVVVSCGRWNQAGWFLQRIGSGWRWHVGGIDCDGGKPAPDRWTHLVGTFDGQTCRLYQDGQLVAKAGGAAIRTPWRRPLHVGQYSGGPSPQYQVFGRLAGLKVYGRALPPAAVRAAAQARPALRKP